MFGEDDAQTYFVSPQSGVTYFNRDTEEESFEHEADLLNFEKNETGFEFTYVNFKDEEITKSYEIKSSSIIEDEKGIWYEWWGPDEWANSD